MRIPNHSLLGLLPLTAVAVLSACGGGNDDPSGPTPTPTLSAAEKCVQLVGKTVAGGEGVVTTAAIRPARRLRRSRPVQ